VGHTLGLTHNFSGSYDSLNYPKRYWELRNDGYMASRAWDPLTQAEIDGRIHEYQYSTVMDYGANFVVTDAHGIGKYDRAAIKMGYGDIVEVFTAVPEQHKATAAMLDSMIDFGSPGAIDPESVVGGNMRIIPYTEIPELVGGIAGLEARRDVRYRDVVGSGELMSPDELIGTPSPVDEAGDYVPVPYYLCTDYFAEVEPSCMRYDAGADRYETIMSVIDQYWNYYVFNSFMRQRIGYDPWDTPDYIYGRYFSKLQNANDFYSIYRYIFSDMATGDDFFEKPDGLGAYTTGLGAAYQLLTKVISTPSASAGCHLKEQTLDGKEIYTAEGENFICDPNSPVIDKFDGRSLYTGYSIGPDLSFLYLTRTGFFQDKVLALEMLVNPGRGIAGSIGEDITVDMRQYQVSFYTTFPEAAGNVLRGIMANDYESYAARWHERQLTFPGPDDHIARAMDGTMIDPNVSFSVLMYAMVYGMSMVPSNFDQGFVDKTRLFVRGGAESVNVDLPGGTEFVEFTDEDSGLTYVAPSYPDGEGRETGVAAAMLGYAHLLRDTGYTTELHLWMDHLNVMRRLTWLLGFGGNFGTDDFTPEDSPMPF
jgi:hypothetical protein